MLGDFVSEYLGKILMSVLLIVVILALWILLFSIQAICFSRDECQTQDFERCILDDRFNRQECIELAAGRK